MLNLKTTPSWFPEVASPADFGCLDEGVPNRPLAVFTALALSPAALAYREKLDLFTANNYMQALQPFNIDGWHRDPALSVEAKSEFSRRLQETLPSYAGKAEFAGDMSENFAQLASGFNTAQMEILAVVQTSQNCSNETVLHTDAAFGYKRTALAYILGGRTRIANSADIENPNENLRSYKFITGDLDSKLVASPELSMAGWRTDDEPAWHVKANCRPNEHRYIFITRTKAGHSPALS